MKLSYLQLVLGPLQNNVFLLADGDTREAVVIDPSFDAGKVIQAAKERGWALTQVWLTHAHFDHTTGANHISRAFEPHLPICIHNDAQEWTQANNKNMQFGFQVDELPPADRFITNGQMLSISPDSNEPVVEVRAAPGHSPGSVIFYCAKLSVAFVGDVIFRESIGRTDLPGGDYATLISSIRAQVFSLPPETKLLPGHGPESSVSYELNNNPYLA